MLTRSLHDLTPVREMSQGKTVSPPDHATTSDAARSWALIVANDVECDLTDYRQAFLLTRIGVAQSAALSLTPRPRMALRKLATDVANLILPVLFPVLGKFDYQTVPMWGTLQTG